MLCEADFLEPVAEVADRLTDLEVVIVPDATRDELPPDFPFRLVSAAELWGPAQAQGAAQPAPGFDFRAFMRATRLHVEELLGQGQVDEAEGYMRAQRDEVQRHGYATRKQNQAYFAIYGSYGGGPAASPRNPIPDLLRQMRERSDSLSDFVFQVRDVTTVDQLRARVAEVPTRG